MTKPRNFPINVAQGTSKNITFVFDDEPDLSSADILFIVKRHATDETEDAVICKSYNEDLSDSLEEGELVITISPSDTTELEARTYIYEIKVTIDDENIYIPTQGSFIVWNSIS